MWHTKGLAEWEDQDTAYLSVVFSWNLPEAHQRAVWLGMEGKRVVAGGPAVRYNPEYLSEVAEIGGDLDALPHHNPDATFTSRGCIRNCKFCAVPKIEGDLVELNDWPVRPIVCDNNLLACSQKHFDSVIDKLKSVKDVDFNQGLDARLLTEHHASRFAELDLPFVRLAWDHIGLEAQFLDSFKTLTDAGIPSKKIRVYVLLGYKDTPEDALYRLEKIRDLGALPNPMRYQELGSLQRNQYVSPDWTKRELKRYMRYWSRQNWLGHIPFSEYRG